MIKRRLSLLGALMILIFQSAQAQTPGCTDSLACNFNSLATEDDGSCNLGPVNDACENAIEIFSGDLLFGDNTGTCIDGPNPPCGNATGAEINDVWYFFNYSGNGEIKLTLDGDDGATLDTRVAIFQSCGGSTVACNDDADTGTNNAPYRDSQIIIACGNLAAGTYVIQAGGWGFSQGTFTINLEIDETPGCTDPAACNYSSAAKCDDGSCILPDGCTDEWACNYNPAALCDDGSCEAISELAFDTPWFTDGEGGSDGFMFDIIALNDMIVNSLGVIFDNGVFQEEKNLQIYAAPQNTSWQGIETNAGSWNLVYNNTVVETGVNPDFIAEGLNVQVQAGQTQAFYIFSADYNIDFRAAANYGGLYVENDDLQIFNGIFTQGLFDPYDGGAFWDSARPSVEIGYLTPRLGCTDPTACNFMSDASCDDGTCYYPDGCIDSSACNFDSLAICDDGTCLYPDCTDALACNYNSSATCDDGSCILPDGCTDTSACNYDVGNLCDDGSCVYPGCINISACNYDSSAGCDDGSCEYLTCRGCTGQLACNYDALATIDDGSCDYISCAGCTYENAPEYDPIATIDDGSCSITASGCPGDFNDDTMIDTSDLLLFLGAFGGSCE